ncbi:hypothetical protein J2S14_002340 [Lederbergia wuyishanensis]|uniref:Uncharacterized protein n=1 Tax=Lederbergia wuyishanensis TaxID=1347903 RepID=A0ABU0D557_9BACI|nr:hypothetical protein [Lederbergia wuyishanensis]
MKQMKANLKTPITEITGRLLFFVVKYFKPLIV